MFTQPFLRSWLTIALVSTLLIAACTAKLQRHSNEPDNATANTTTQTAPTPSAKANEKIDTTLTLEKLKRKDGYGTAREGEYYLDTALTNHLPHFNAQELFTYYRFLFDLGKDDSLYCPRCKDSSFVNSKDRPNFEYYYYYKGVLVQNRYIHLQTDGHLKIERIRVNYKPIKEMDVVPQMSVQEAAKKAAEELIEGQRLEIEDRGKLFGAPYNGSDLVPYYAGLKIIPEYVHGEGNKLAHYFRWRTWGITVYDKGDYAYSGNSLQHLCENCNFSTATYTTQTVPTYHNATFAYGVGGNVPLEVQSCNQTDIIKRYRLQQNANPFHVVYQSTVTAYTNVDYEEADWYSVASITGIDPATTVNDIKTVNGIISATVMGITNPNHSNLTNNAINPTTVTYINNCSNTLPIAIGATPIPAGMTVVADIYRKTMYLTLPTTQNYSDVAPEYQISIAGGSDYQEWIGQPLSLAPENNRYALQNVAAAPSYPFSWGNYAVLVHPIGTDKYYAFNNIRLAPDATMQPKANLVTYCLDATHTFFSNAGGTVNGNAIHINMGNSSDVTTFTGDITSLANAATDSKKFPVYLTTDQGYGAIEAGPLNPITGPIPDYPHGALSYDISGNMPTITADAVAHEYVHGIEDKKQHMNNTGPGHEEEQIASFETGAIEEGLCDIFGLLVEGTLEPLDWSLQNDIFPVGDHHTRDFATPKANLNPDTYQGIYWSAADMHASSTVISHWFYLLSQGGSGINDNGCAYTVTGVGLDIATKIAYRILTDKVAETETMDMFANSAILAARDITNNSDACDPIVVKTANALLAVGLVPTNCTCTGYEPCNANHSKLPRIDKVSVSEGGKTYMSQKIVWRNEGGVAKLCFEHQQNKLPIPANANITIVVTTSEKMATLNFEGFKKGTTTYQSPTYWTAGTSSNVDDGTTWTFHIQNVNLPSSTTVPYQLLFTGTDMQGNALERMQEYTGFPCDINYNQLPIYNGSGWTPDAKPASTTTPHAVFDVLIADCSSSPETDLCDNRLPYLTKMHAQEGISIAAEQEWIQNGNNLCLSDNYPAYYTNFANNVVITITASERLSQLHLNALSLGNAYYDLSNTTYFTVSTPTTLDEGLTWTMTMHQNQAVISNAYSSNNVYLLHFTGTDLAGNPLEVMQNYTSYNATTKCVAVSDAPVRTANGSWTGTSSGTDTNFWLNIDYCPSWYFGVQFDVNMGIVLTSTPANTIASWQLVDNATGLSTTHQVVGANDNIAYYFNNTTFGLPQNYTLYVTNTNGCTKMIALTAPTSNCNKPNVSALVSSVTAAGSQTNLTVQIDLSTFVPPCQVFITQGSSAALNTTVTSGVPTNFTVTIPTAQLCNGIGYYVRDSNGCIASGVLNNDVYLRDNLWDGLNNEPNITTDIAIPGTTNTWNAIWESPDLWNSYNATIPTLLANQDPNNEKINYNISNFLKVRLFSANNYACTTGKVKLYWTVASTGEMWSEHWIDNDGIANCKVGDQIGEINITQADYPIPANGKIFNLAWTPPVFPNSVEGCDLANVNNFIEGTEGKTVEMCLLARFESDKDPIKNESNGYVTYNILNSKNIVTRNTIYLYAPAGGNTPTGVPSIVYIRNNNNFSANLNVVAQNLLKPTAQQQSQYYIEFVLSEKFWDRWTSNGQQSVGVEVIEPKVVRITNFTTAKLIGVPLLANEALPIGVRLRLKTGGKADNYTPETKQVNFFITHEATDPNVAITPPSACVFHAAKANKQATLGNNNAMQLSIVPNPNNGIATLYYTLANNSTVSISLYNAQGKQVKVLLNTANQTAGNYTQAINTPDLPAGLYFCTIETNNGTSVTKWVKF